MPCVGEVKVPGDGGLRISTDIQRVHGNQRHKHLLTSSADKEDTGLYPEVFLIESAFLALGLIGQAIFMLDARITRLHRVFHLLLYF